MNSPEHILQLQRSLASASGSRKIALGIMIAAGVACIAQLVTDRSSTVLGTVTTWTLTIAVMAYQEAACRRRVRELDAQLREK